MATNSPDYTPIYQAAGNEWNVDPRLLQAVAGQEGGGVSNVSSAGAMGHMQIMPGTAKELGVTNPNDVTQSVYGGAKYLSQMLDRYGTPELALSAYNAGPGRVDQHLASNGTVPLPAETQAYVPGVTRRYQALARADQPVPAPQPAAAPQRAPASLVAPPMGDDPFSKALAGAPDDATPASSVAPPLGDDPFSKALAPVAVAPVTAPPWYAAVSPGSNLINGGGSSTPSPYTAPTDTKATAEQQIRTALAPAPNTTYGSVIPVAKDDATGAVRIALPSSLRDFGTGMMDLVEGPSTGTVTPAATGALFGIASGGGIAPSVARNTGTAIGSRLLPKNDLALGRNEVPDLLGADLRAAPQLGMQLPAAMAQNNLAPPTAPTSMPIPGTPPPTANALTFPSMRKLPEPQPATNAPAGTPTPTEGINLLTGAPPTTQPPRTMLPIVTQGQASAHVDNLLKHFGQGGNTVPSPSPIAGSPSTLAQSTGNAGFAALENGLRGTDPHFNNLYNAQAGIRTAQRAETFQGVAGTANDIDLAEQARDAATSSARDAAFADAKPVDPAPVVDTINTILASPDGKRDAVVRSLQPILDKLQTSNGTGLETDPAQLYGIRKAINDRLASVGTQEGADAKSATRQLMQVRDQLDQTIEPGAPGFGAYIQQYSDASRPIDAMRWLQGQNITDQLGNIQLGKLDSTVKRLEAQQAKPGASLADSVTPEQMQTLRTLRDDMRQEAAVNKTLPVNSTTVQNLATNRLMSGAKGVADGASALGALSLHPAGLVPFAARMGMNKLSASGNALVQQELRNRLLNPLASSKPAP